MPNKQKEGSRSGILMQFLPKWVIPMEICRYADTGLFADIGLSNELRNIQDKLTRCRPVITCRGVHYWQVQQRPVINCRFWLAKIVPLRGSGLSAYQMRSSIARHHSLEVSRRHLRTWVNLKTKFCCTQRMMFTFLPLSKPVPVLQFFLLSRQPRRDKICKFLI